MENALLPAINKIVCDAEKKISVLLNEKVRIYIQSCEGGVYEMSLEQVLCDVFDCTWDDIIGKDRYQKLVTARIIYTYYMREMKFSYVEIGHRTNRHHSTSIYHMKLFNRFIDTNDTYFIKMFNEVSKKLGK